MLFPFSSLTLPSSIVVTKSLTDRRQGEFSILSFAGGSSLFFSLQVLSRELAVHSRRSGVLSMAMWRHSFSTDPPEYPMDWAATSCGCWTQLSYPLTTCLNPYQICMWVRRWRQPPPPPLQRHLEGPSQRSACGLEVIPISIATPEMHATATQTIDVESEVSVIPPADVEPHGPPVLERKREFASGMQREVSEAELRLRQWLTDSTTPNMSPGGGQQMRHWDRTAGRDGHETLFPPPIPLEIPCEVRPFFFYV